MTDDYEVARQSPIQFWSKADHARYSAYCLWTLAQSGPPDPTPIGGEWGRCKVALLESWLRESSLALELIVKAAFAQNEVQQPMPMSVPSTHDVPKLWAMAQLPRVNGQQAYHLQMAYQILQWSGRYAAPRKGRPDLFADMDRFRKRISVGRASHLEPIRVDWDSFEELYQIAFNRYLECGAAA